MEEKTKELVEKRAGVGSNGCCIPASMRSPEERRRLAKLGAQKAQEKAKRERTLNEIAKALLRQEVPREQARQVLGDMADMLDEDFSLGAILTMRQAVEAQEGNTKAYEVLRDTAGYKPVDQVQAEVNVLSDQDRSLLDKVARRTGVEPEEP